MSDLSIPSRLPAGATGEGDGILIGNGPVRVDAFIDFMCPFCRRFELSAGPALADLVSAGQISLIYHPASRGRTRAYRCQAGRTGNCSGAGRLGVHHVRLRCAIPGLAAVCGGACHRPGRRGDAYRPGRRRACQS
jgi:hypothetical protein